MIQISPTNPHHCDGNIRGSLFRGYPGDITVALAPVRRLSESEVERAEDFARACRLSDYQQEVLVECAPVSGISWMCTSDWVGGMPMIHMLEDNRMPVHVCNAGVQEVASG